MTLDRLRPVATRVLGPIVLVADTIGLTPDRVSVIALLVAAAAGAAFAAATPTTYVAGAILVFLNGWLDLLDGALAREQGSSSRAGDLLDHVVDRYADILLVAGLAAGVGRYGLGFVAVTGVLMTSYHGTQTQAIGLERSYGGLVGRADRLALIGVVAVAVAVVPEPLFSGLTLVGLLLAFFAIIGHVTALQRFWGAWSDL